MEQRPHLFPRETSSVKLYTYAKPVGSSEFRVPPRDRVPHSQSLVAQIENPLERICKLEADCKRGTTQPGKSNVGRLGKQVLADQARHRDGRRESRHRPHNRSSRLCR